MKRKHILLLLAIIVANLLPAVAQNKNKFDLQAFKERKAKFIATEANLTASEEKAFTPLMNELMDKRFELNREIRRQSRYLKNKKDKTDADYTSYIELEYKNKVKELELDKEYYDKFKKILSPEKIYKSQKAENKFLKEVVNQNRAKNKSSR